MSEPVLKTINDGLLTITLARPEAGNAVSPATIESLARAVDDAERASTRAVLINAQGRHFCVGADLRHLEHPETTLPGELDRMATGFHAMLLRLTALAVPVVAAVQGHAVGGGLGLALAADVILCGEGARFSTGYAKLGLSPDAGVSHFLTRALGPRLARSLLMTARVVPADEALRWGLVDQVVADEALATTARTTAMSLADGPTAAFAAVKRLVAGAEAGAPLDRHLDDEREAIVTLAADRETQAAIGRALRQTIKR